MTPGTAPGNAIRALRKRRRMTLRDMSSSTGLAVSTLSKLEMGRSSLSYDKLVRISTGLGVELAQLLDSTPRSGKGLGCSARRAVHRGGEGKWIERPASRQLDLATDLLNRQFTPLIVESRVCSLQAFLAEFGDYERHAGEAFIYVLEGEIELHTEHYAPLRLRAGDSIYFDAAMGHACLKASEGRCRSLVVSSPVPA